MVSNRCMRMGYGMRVGSMGSRMAMVMTVVVPEPQEGLTANARLFFKFFDASSMQRSGVSSSSLLTSVWKKLEDGLEVFFCTFGRSRKCDDQSPSSNSRNGS